MLPRMRICAALLFVLSLLSPALAAPPAEPVRGDVERAFRTWLEKEIWPEARAGGVSRATFDRTLGQMTVEWSLPELVLPGQKPDLTGPEIHAEFRSPAAYFNEKNIANVVARGRSELAKLGTTLAAIESRFGVPKTILLAFWGRETYFGDEKLPVRAIDALATQAFIGKRKEIFRPELIAALQIVERGEAEPAAMRASWAGALGQPQLLPSDFLRSGMDFDGDGKRDIWRSAPDALATMANFIRSKGWMADRPWGVEASVPTSVSCALEGPEKGKTAAEWTKLGVTTIGGGKLPGDSQIRFLLMPAGRYGPAFIVSENFYTMKEYNNSDLYALFVGNVADRISGGGPFKTPWTAPPTFGRAAILKMQEKLAAEGKDVGRLDGLVGFKTRIAIGEWQAARGMPATCFPDAALLARFD